MSNDVANLMSAADFEDRNWHLLADSRHQASEKLWSRMEPGSRVKRMAQEILDGPQAVVSHVPLKETLISKRNPV